MRKRSILVLAQVALFTLRPCALSAVTVFGERPYVDGYFVGVDGGDLYDIGLRADDGEALGQECPPIEYYMPPVSSLIQKHHLFGTGREPITYYVDPTNGNDTNSGTSPESPFNTVQKAVDSAQDGDTVILSRGRYSGSGNRDVDFGGKAVTVQSTDPNDPNVVAATIIDCNGTPEEPHRGFRFNSGESANSILAGITIRHGYAPEEMFVSDMRPLGGAIFCDGSSPTIVNCIITENSARSGGGVYCNHANPNIANCTLSGNLASDMGGGICCYWYGSAIVANCTVSGNSAGWGGGAFLSGETSITNCVIKNNSANYGGGIYCNMEPQISNCVLSENRAGIYGGGILWHTGTITNCTIVNNSAGWAGSGVHSWSNYGATISNCILWDDDFYNDYGCTPVVNYSCVQTWSGDIDGIIDWIIDGGNVSQDPLFANPTNGDYHLLPGSPCIDAGDNTAVPPEITTDSDGNSRFLDDPTTADTGKGTAPIVDMGAYEYALRVYNTGQERYHRTIQEAIDNAGRSDEIAVTPGIYTGTGNRDIDFAGKSIMVRSLDPADSAVVASTVIDCRARESDPHRGFYFHSGEDPNSILEGFTIINGYGPNEPLGGNEYSAGGAIYCSDSSPTIRKCIIRDNYAGFWGGGVWFNNSRALVTECTFKDNESGDTGGGIYSRLSAITVSNCQFIGNSAPYGGGMYSADGSPTVKNSIFTTNTAAGKGGAIRNNRVTSTITNCTFYGNNAPEGSAVHNKDSQSTTITNSILWGNPDSEVEGDAQLAYCDVEGGYPGLGNIDADPSFADPCNDDFHLLADSPCINTGDPNYVPSDGETDMDNEARILDGRVEMGADEYGILYVSAYSPNDPGSGTAEDPYRRIQDAVEEARGGEEIHVGQGIYNEAVVITTELNLYGGYDSNNWASSPAPNANCTVVSGYGLPEIPFAVVNIFDANVTVSGLRIRDAFKGSVYEHGTGICCASAVKRPFTVNVSHNVVEDNVVYAWGDGAAGGGIYCDEYVRAVIVGNVVTNNAIFSAGYAKGIGIYCGGSQCEISGNSVVGNFFGGYSSCAGWCDGSGGAGIWIGGGVVSVNTVVGNSIQDTLHFQGPGLRGGGIYCDSPSIVTGNEVRGNSLFSRGCEPCGALSDVRGGGIYAPNSEIISNTVIGNECRAEGGNYYQDYCNGSGGIAYGGGIYAPSAVITGNRVSGNNAIGIGYDGSPRPSPGEFTRGGDGIAEGGGIYGPGSIFTANSVEGNGVVAEAGKGYVYEQIHDPNLDGVSIAEGPNIYPECESPLLGDIILDCRVDARDIKVLVSNWLADSSSSPPCETIVAGDLNDDCNINFEDFCIMALDWMEEHD